ncbi:MAG: DUF420 domain-containing protein [Chlorobi bacterium]|nr:DUF420 domain-containing protein [Chlorobiota bacterium]
MIDKTRIFWTFILSIAIASIVLIIYYYEGEGRDIPQWMKRIPQYNAMINTLTTLFLLAGFLSIKKYRITLHKTFMLLAALTTLTFFVLYSIYHVNVPPTKFNGPQGIKYVYYFVLISHIIAATVTLPLAILTFWLGLEGKFSHHRKIAKFTFPIWLYATITGVLTYVFLAPYYQI